MMPEAVIEFLNDAGSVVLSNSGSQLVYVAKGTHAVSGSGNAIQFGRLSYLTITCAETAIVALRPTNASIRVLVINSTYASGQRTLTLFTTGTASETIGWWVFDKPSVYSPANIRFEVYDDATGGLLWRLYANPLKVLGTGSITASGRTLAGIQGNMAGTRGDEYVRTTPADVDMYRNRVRWQSFMVNASGDASWPSTLWGEGSEHSTSIVPIVTYGPAQRLTIDVSGL